MPSTALLSSRPPVVEATGELPPVTVDVPGTLVDGQDATLGMVDATEAG